MLLALLIAGCHSKKQIVLTEADNPDRALCRKYANLLEVEPHVITNLVLYRFIDDWYGVPYKYGGKSQDGVDCSGLTSILYAKVYERSVSGSSASIWKLCTEVPSGELKEGDLVFFKIGSDKISHIGIYLHNNRFVHASVHKGVMISSLKEAYYQNYFYKGGRIKE
jgi:lipoprotein Spr